MDSMQMYLSLPGRYYGGDNIVRYTGNLSDEWSVGDLLLVDGQYALILGDETAWGCDYELSGGSVHLSEQSLLSPSCVQLAHRMVREWYSSYRKVLPLWLSSDVPSLLKRKPQTPPSPCPDGPHLISTDTSWIMSDQVTEGQQCIVFPDLWTLSSTVSKSLRHDPAVVLLTSSLTEKQRNDARWSIKYGTKRIILTTPAGFFVDRYQLRDIQIVDPHLWYYKNRQNPRFVTSDVVEKMKTLHLER